MRRSNLQNFLSRGVSTLALGALALVGGCGGGSGGSSDATISFALTDAASDEIVSFTVDVDAVTLTRRSGAVVSALAQPVTVDLVTLEDLSQLLNTMALPEGFYDAASITFDFTNASCVLVGQSTPAALFDSLGNPLTGTVTLPLSLLRMPVVAIGGRHRVVELDFDLEDSLTVDAVNNAVTVDPSLVLRVDRSDPKPLVLLGALQTVDTGTSIAGIDVETLGQTVLGTATLKFNGATVYQVDGVPAAGTQGLAALALKPMGTWIQAYGAAETQSQIFDVSYVEAGSGTWNGGSDVVEGEIVDRSGGAGADATLTVLGHSDDASHTTFQFNQLFTVDTSFANTKVVRRGSSANFDGDDLNVGQLVRCFGSLTGLTLDATAAGSVVREQETRLFGFANGAPSGGTLEIDLQRDDLRDQGDFNWPAGGTTPPDPAHFTSNVGSLGDSLGIDVGTAVEVRGFVSGVADANQDVVANALVNRDLVGSLFVLHDRIGGFTVATSTSATQVQFTITGTQAPGELAIIDQGFVGVTQLPTAPTPTVVADPAALVFTVRDQLTGAITFESDYANFTQDVADALGNGRQLHDFNAIGGYDLASNTFTAVFASAVIR